MVRFLQTSVEIEAAPIIGSFVTLGIITLSAADGIVLEFQLPVVFQTEFVAPVQVRRNVNGSAEVAVPPGVTTEMVPDAPPATTAVMLVALTTLNEVAAVPPKLTAVAPVKLVPVIVSVVPVPAEVGVKEVMVGIAAGDRLNFFSRPSIKRVCPKSQKYLFGHTHFIQLTINGLF
jgi:hypothetical protein